MAIKTTTLDALLAIARRSKKAEVTVSRRMLIAVLEQHDALVCGTRNMARQMRPQREAPLIDGEVVMR